MMKRILLALCNILLAFSLTACGLGETQPLVTTSSAAPSSQITQDSKVSTNEHLGQVTSSTEHIPEISGAIQIEAVDSNAPSSEPTPPTSTTTPKKPAVTSEESSSKIITPPLVTSNPPVSTATTPKQDKNTPPPVQEEIKSAPTSSESTPTPIVPEEDIMRSIQITVGNKIFFATLEKNDAANSFMQLLQSSPIVLQMSDYSGFEKVGTLETSLPESNRHITTQSGDIILYNGNQIVVFYGSNSWSYTKLGKIDDLSGWEDALGGGDVTLTFRVN